MLTSLPLKSAMPDSSEGRTYYIDAEKGFDTGDGSKQHPFKRISVATRLAGPGDRILIGDGIYRETIRPSKGGEAGKPLIFEAAPGARPVVRGTDLLNGPWDRKEKNGSVFYATALPPNLFSEYRMPWSDGYACPGNPFHTKIIVSNMRTKTSRSPAARPWPPKQTTKTTEGEETFDTYTRKAIYDGPERTLPRTLGLVFAGEQHLTQAVSLEGLLLAPGSFLVSADGNELLVHFPIGTSPATAPVEITTRAQCFVPEKRGLSFLEIRGITFERAANQGPFPQAGIVSTRSGKSWLIENCTIRHASTIGLDVGGETWGDIVEPKGMRTSRNIEIRSCTISDNGLCGIAGYSTRELVVRNSLIERNNNLDITPGINAGWWEQAGIKLHASANALIEGNIIRDNEAFGMWIDTHFTNSRVTRNLVVNNKLSGVFAEKGWGPFLIDHNVIGGTRSGHGIYAHDASGVIAAHNLIIRNSGVGVLMRNVRPVSQKAETSANIIYANLILGNYTAAIGLPVTDAQNKGNYCDWNVYGGGTHFYDPGPVEMILLEQTNDPKRAGGLFETARSPAHPPAGWEPFGTALSVTKDWHTRQWKDEDTLVMSLPTWKQVLEWDVHSVSPFSLKDRYMILRPRELNFEWEVPQAVAELNLPDEWPDGIQKAMAVMVAKSKSADAEALQKVTRDYHGQTRGRAPGPFQSLTAGQGIFPVTPVMPSWSAKEVRLEKTESGNNSTQAAK